MLRRRVHFAGSAGTSVDPGTLAKAHDVVGQTVRGILAGGGGLVAQLGREPMLEAEHPLALTFDWTVLDVLAQELRRDLAAAAGLQPTIVGVSSEKSETEIPHDRRRLVDELLASGHMEVIQIPPGWRSGAVLRTRQAQLGDVLITLGGGAGVEHLAELYTLRQRPIIPLDFPLGASRGDGLIGGQGLAREARSSPKRFFTLQETGSEGARLASLSSNAHADLLSSSLLQLVADLALPTAFFVRLLNKSHEDFSAVEDFIRAVADPLVYELGFEGVEVGNAEMHEGFLNIEIFRQLHFASVVVVDLTGLRPNCLIELGYAFGHQTPVILTAKAGTELPFDSQAIPCHFWGGRPREEEMSEFRSFWGINVGRMPLIVPQGLMP